MPEVVEPCTEGEVSAILRDANEAGRVILPRGGGTKLQWGNPGSSPDCILSTARLDRVIEHAWQDLTVTVEAGCTVAELQRTLARHGQRLGIDVLWPERATVGGILSTNDSGALRLRYGGLRDLLIGATLALADGTLAKSGGKVVKNVAGYDLPKLAVGALGTLGVITRAVFRLHPLPQRERTLSIALRDRNEVQHVMAAIQNSHLAHSALQARLANDQTPRLDVLLEGTPAGIAAQETQIRAVVSANITEEEDVWNTRQKLWDQPGAIGKFSVLPCAITETLELIPGPWTAVVQATGIGWLRFDASSAPELRTSIERCSGSLVILRDAGDLDAWGDVGDKLTLMRALKTQFDPRGTLNRGRFVGGI